MSAVRSRGRRACCHLAPEDLVYDDVVHTRMLNAARAVGLAVIDPLAELRVTATSGRLYYRRDWHLNERGNAALELILDRQLGQLGMMPAGVEPKPRNVGFASQFLRTRGSKSGC